MPVQLSHSDGGGPGPAGRPRQFNGSYLIGESISVAVSASGGCGSSASGHVIFKLAQPECSLRRVTCHIAQPLSRVICPANVQQRDLELLNIGRITLDKYSAPHRPRVRILLGMNDPT